MALAPFHPCPGRPTCRNRVRSGRCPDCARRWEQARPNTDIRRLYFTERWKTLRRFVLLAQHHACAECGHVELVLDVDHIKPHHGDLQKFWNPQNLQALCAACHGKKTRSGA